LGEGRNILVVRSSDILSAIGGGYGTLSEIGFALKINKTVIGINTWKNIEGITYAKDVPDALNILDHIISGGS
jgi:hypothetical protein